MQISASASSRLTLVQANKDRATLDPDIPAPSRARSRWFRFNPVFDCRVCSSPLPAPGRRSRERQEGKRCELDDRHGWHRLRPRVTDRHFFWSNCCCMHGRAHWFYVDSDMSRFSWLFLALALLGLHSSRRYTHKLTPFECRPILF